MDDVKELPDGRFSILHRKVEFECVYHYKASDKLYVVLNGARDHLKSRLPIFKRWSFYKHFDGTVLNVADPMYRKYDGLSIGWYYGNSEENYLEYLLEVVEKVANSMKIESHNITFYSSSAGGYAALYCATRIKGSTAIAINPQIKLNLWPWTKNFQEVVGVDFSEDDLFDRNNLPELIRQAKESRFVICINCRSREDMQQLHNLCNTVGSDIAYGICKLQSNIITWVYDAEGEHLHNACDYPALVNAILKLCNEKLDIEKDTSYFQMIQEQWHERFNVFYQMELVKEKNKREIIEVLYGENDKELKKENIICMKEFLVEAKDYIWNHSVICRDLEPSTLYEFECESSSILSGNSDGFTILVRDTKLNYIAYKRYCKFNKQITLQFKTSHDASDLELRIYPGNAGESAKISVRLEYVKLNKFVSKQNEITIPKTLFGEKIQDVVNGYNIANAVCNEPDVSYVVINRHIGDAARNLTIIRPFKLYYSEKEKYHFMNNNQDGINCYAFPKKMVVKKVCVLTTRVLSGVVKLCPEVDDVVVLGKKELDELELYVNSAMCLHKNIFPDEDSAANMLKWNLYKTGTFAYRMNLPKEFVEKESGKLKITDKILVESEQYLSNNSMDASKSIILCPVAQSNSLLGKAFWDKLIINLKNKGYVVYTNIGPNEQPLEGTNPLCVPIDIICGLVSCGCKVIGVQSGLLDLLIWLKKDFSITVLSVIKTERDLQFAKNRGLVDEVTKREKVTYIKIDNMEEKDYVTLIMEAMQNNE